jgi:hypothetical protein
MPKLLQILGLFLTFVAAVLLSIDNIGTPKVINGISILNSFMIRNRVKIFPIISICLFLGLYYATTEGIVQTLFQILSNWYVIAAPLMCILALIFVLIVAEGGAGFLNLISRMWDIVVTVFYHTPVRLVTNKHLMSWRAFLLYVRLQFQTHLRITRFDRFIEGLLLLLIAGQTIYATSSRKETLLMISLAINLLFVLGFALVWLARFLMFRLLTILQFFVNRPERTTFRLSIVGYVFLSVGFLLQLIYAFLD